MMKTTASAAAAAVRCILCRSGQPRRDETMDAFGGRQQIERVVVVVATAAAAVMSRVLLLQRPVSVQQDSIDP